MTIETVCESPIYHLKRVPNSLETVRASGSSREIRIMNSACFPFAYTCVMANKS